MRHITQSFRLELIRALVTSFEGKKVEVASRPSFAACAPEWSIWITPGLADAQVTAAKAKLEDLWRVRHITQTLKRERATTYDHSVSRTEFGIHNLKAGVLVNWYNSMNLGTI